MEKKIQHKESRGLPGGPNEMPVYVTGPFSIEGFRMDSPDVNNYQNIIPSGSITMKEKDGSPLRKGPIHGVDNLGNEQVMYPGYDYEFPGTEVTETLMAKMGGTLLDKTIKCGNCGWEWKAVDGGSDVMDCHKCGGKGLMKAQAGVEIIPGGKNIKLRNSDGSIRLLNTGSPEYIEMYNDGDIQSEKNMANDLFFGGVIDEVVVKGKVSELGKLRKEYSQKNTYEDFVNKKKDEYIKRLGKSNWYGIDRNNFPEKVLAEIKQNYDYNKNTYAVEQLAKKRNIDLNERGAWVDNLTSQEQNALINSKYSAQLNANEFSNALSGLQQLGNTVLPGKPFDFNIPGLTPNENKEDAEAKLSALKIFAPLNVPGNYIANAMKNTTTSSYGDFREKPMIGTQRMGNVSEMESMALNPISYEAIASLPTLLKSGYNITKQGLTKGSEFFKNALSASSSIDNTGIASNNLNDLTYANDWAKKYGYKLPENLERIAQSDVLTDRTIRGLADRHNTFVRGVSTNWDILGQKNPEIIKHLESQGFDLATETGSKAAAEYMSTHIPMNTGYGRFGLKEGENALYLSNSVPTAEGYTYGNGYIVKAKRPTDFSSTNRQDWLTTNDFDPSLGFKGSPFGEGIVKNDYIKRFPTNIRETLAITGDPNKMTELQATVKEKEALYNELAHASWKKNNNLIDDLKYRTDSNYRNYTISDEPFIRDTPNFLDKMHLKYLQNKKDLTQKYYDVLPLKDIAKGVYGDADVWKAFSKNLFGELDPFSHYAIKGQEGEKVLEALKSIKVNPEAWENTSRAHINKYTNKLTRRQDGGDEKEDTSWTAYLNPANWGTSRYDDAGTFKEAFRAARNEGDSDFLWKGERYSTELKAEPKAPAKPKGITPELLIRQAYRESAFNPNVVSHAGYKGLGQIGDAVIKDYKKANNITGNIDPFNIKQNSDVQKYSMNELYNSSFINKPGQSENVRLAKTLASYNWGRGNVMNLLNDLKEEGVDIYNSLDWVSKLPEEPRNYINDILLQKNTTFNTDFSKALGNQKNKPIKRLYGFRDGGESKPGLLMQAYNRLPAEKKMGGAIDYKQGGGQNKYSEQDGRLVVTTKKVDTEDGPRYYQAKSPDYNFSRELVDARRVSDSIPKATLNPRIIQSLNKREFGGQLNSGNITMYKDYVKGNIGNEEQAVKNYDKLNRIYYSKAKELGMTAANYIMTYIVGNS